MSNGVNRRLIHRKLTKFVKVMYHLGMKRQRQKIVRNHYHQTVAGR